MPQSLLKNKVDIYQKPTANNAHFQQITIGDLHANAMKFLYFLVAEGVFDISEQHYNELAKLYQKDIFNQSDEALKGDIERFDVLIDSALALKHSALVRLIGDEVGDRGQNDYFILKILGKLHQSGVPIEILISNHGIEFIEATERLNARKGKFTHTVLKSKYVNSLSNMERLRERKGVTTQRILTLANAAYKPALKAVSYSLNAAQDEITLYSHAGIDLLPIQYLAEKLGVAFSDASAITLAKTIDAINNEIQNYVLKGKLHEIYSFRWNRVDYNGNIILHKNNPLEFIMWNRVYENPKKQNSFFWNTLYEYSCEVEVGLTTRAPMHKGYRINYVHGHDANDETKNNIYNLDSSLGKRLDRNKGKYLVLRSNDAGLTLSLQKEGYANDSFSLSMFLLGEFIAVIGIAAVAVAFTAFSSGSAPALVVGVVAATAVVAMTLAKMGMFGHNNGGADGRLQVGINPLHPATNALPKNRVPCH